MDLNLVLRIDSTPPLSYESTFENKRKRKLWEKSNCMCLVIMKKRLFHKHFRANLLKTTAKEILAKIEKIMC